jgi:hypothetical protein
MSARDPKMVNAAFIDDLARAMIPFWTEWAAAVNILLGGRDACPPLDAAYVGFPPAQDHR